MAEFSFYEKFVQQYGLDRTLGVVNIEYLLKTADKILYEAERIIDSKAVDMIPDYTNMESVNRILDNGGTWTVDRHGFVFCFIYNKVQNVNSAGFYKIKINNNVVTQVFYNSYSVSNGEHVMPQAANGVFRVKPGDIIQLESTPIESYPNIIVFCGCQFIPPKSVSVSVL
jgi:hypothetical protein